jgi:hypothetical protein
MSASIPIQHGVISSRFPCAQAAKNCTRSGARTATGAERTRLWQKALEFWPPYADYEEKTEREIPVVVLNLIG